MSKPIFQIHISFIQIEAIQRRLSPRDSPYPEHGVVGALLGAVLADVGEQLPDHEAEHVDLVLGRPQVDQNRVSAGGRSGRVSSGHERSAKVSIGLDQDKGYRCTSLAEFLLSPATFICATNSILYKKKY